MPNDYQPASFGQAWTRDKGCAFWSVLFLIGSTMIGSQAFIANVIHAKTENTLALFVHQKLNYLMKGLTDPVWLNACINRGNYWNMMSTKKRRRKQLKQTA